MNTRTHIHKIYYPILGILLIFSTLGGAAWAINAIADGWRAPVNNTITVGAANGECRRVSVSTAAPGDVFVPTRTTTEWTNFKNNKPSSVTLNACTTVTHCPANGIVFDGTTTRPGCNVVDKIVCTGVGVGVTWSMCNVGTNTVGTYGSLYQWGRNVAFGVSGNPSTTNYPTVSAGKFVITPSNGRVNDGDDENFGDWLNTRTVPRSFPVCPAGYHVPSSSELCATLSAFGMNICGSTPYIESEGTNDGVSTTFRTTLNFPYNGHINDAEGELKNRDSEGTYWTTGYDTNGNKAIAFAVVGDTVKYYAEDRADAYAVRCVRD